MSEAIIVKIDKDAFLRDVQGLLEPALVAKLQEQASVLLKLKYPEAFKPPELWLTLGKLQLLISLVCASIEVAKQKLITNTECASGEIVKFDKAVALETAVRLLDDLVVLDGWAGNIIDKFDAPVLNVLISMYISGKSGNWLEEAEHILGASR